MSLSDPARKTTRCSALSEHGGVGTGNDGGGHESYEGYEGQASPYKECVRYEAYEGHEDQSGCKRHEGHEGNEKQ